MEYSEAKDLYTQLIATLSGVELKGKTMPYTSLNGHMYSFLSKEGKVGLRLSSDDLSEAIQAYDTELMVQHGRTMKEYLRIPESLLNDIGNLATLLQQHRSHIR